MGGGGGGGSWADTSVQPNLGFIKYDVHATCLVYYLFSLIDSSEEMWLYWYFLRQKQVIIQLVEVPVLSQESERS
jgi:hypothetical protein